MDLSKRLTAGRVRRCRRYRHAAELACVGTACEPEMLLGICLIESCYRPLPLRVAEYAAVGVLGLWSLITGRTLHNFTLGPCQLGLSAFLSNTFSEEDMHIPAVHLNTVSDYLRMYTSLSYSGSFALLARRLDAASQEAAVCWPERRELRCRHVGQTFGGRFTYGLMLEYAVRALTAAKDETAT